MSAFSNPKEDIMKRDYLIKGIVVAAAVFILGYGANAFAGWGRGPGYGGCGGPGSRWGGAGYGDASMSAEQYKQLDEERRSFFENTADLRQEIYQKDLDLRSELAKAEPDAAKASRLQKELSQLEADLEQKRFDHMMAVRKINPEAGRGYGWGGRGGYGNCPGFNGGQRCW
jgi:zinc resistance-associated protein